MRQIRTSSLILLGALVGSGGCVSGAIDGETPPGGANSGSVSGFGATTSLGGTPNAGGNPGVSGTNANNMTTGGNAAGNPGTAGTTPMGGTPSGGVSSGGASGGVSSGGSGGNGGSGGSGGSVSTPKDCKRGIAYPSDTLTNAEATAGLTWWYNWGIGIKAVGAGLEFTPMISGGGTSVANANAIRADAKYLLGYNEPNFFEQANMSAAQAAADWPTLEAVAKAKNLKLVSPAVNYCGDDANKTGPCHDTNPAHYLQTFFAACANCQVDYVAVHWYNCDGASLNSYLDMFKQFNRPIWLTEFACAYGGDTSVAGQQKYMDEAIPILEARTDVFRYAWFSGDPIPNAKLLNNDGTSTELGKHYFALAHDPGCSP